MRQVLVFVAGVVLAGSALAGSCPVHMKAIDARLASKPAPSKDVVDQVAKLRKSGEDHHKAGKHADSMKDLAEAKKLLGI